MTELEDPPAQARLPAAPRPAVSAGAIEFDVPGQPIGKGRPRATSVAGHARLYTPKTTSDYEKTIGWCAKEAMRGRHPFAGPVACVMLIGMGVPKSWSAKDRRAALAGEILPTSKPDTDNIVKAIFDGCNGVVYRDDVQVVDLSLRKRYVVSPGVRVHIKPLLVGLQGALL